MSDPAGGGMDVFEAMGSARAMRWFRPDPVPDELIERLLWAATRASSPNNTQAWDFVVVRDTDQRRRLGEAVAPLVSRFAAMPDSGSDTDRRTMAGARNLAEHLADIPVIIVVCGANVYPPAAPREVFMYSAIHAASQNLIVAARALGLGAAFTTLHHANDAAFREILGIPADRTIGCTIPVGWPAGPTGAVTRRPLGNVAHYDRW